MNKDYVTEITSNIMAAIKPLNDSHNTTVKHVRALEHAMVELEQRMKVLEAQNIRLKDDITWLMRAECEKADPIHSPWRTISTR